MVSGNIIPLSEGINPSGMDSLVANFYLFKPRNFLMPFLAHAVGTLVGAIIGTKIAATYKLKLALSLGVLFLLGGIKMATILPTPLWFGITNLGFAYLPMAYLGYRLAK